MRPQCLRVTGTQLSRLAAFKNADCRISPTDNPPLPLVESKNAERPPVESAVCLSAVCLPSPTAAEQKKTGIGLRSNSVVVVRVSAQRCTSELRAVCPLGHLQKLQLLGFADDVVVSEQDFAVLAECEALEHLDIGGCVSSECRLALAKSLSLLPCLTSVNLSGAGALKACDLELMSPLTLAVIDCELRRENNAKANPLGVLARQWGPSLRELRVRYHECTRHEASQLRHFRRLTHLQFVDVEATVVSCVIHAVQSLALHLRVLDIACCISELSLGIFGFRPDAHLRLNDRDLYKLQRLTQLSTLRLLISHRLVNLCPLSGLQFLRMPNLRAIHLWAGAFGTLSLWALRASGRRVWTGRELECLLARHDRLV